MILVTGANGLLGSQIVRKLLEKKIDFVALKRVGSDISLLEKELVTWVEGDILDINTLFDNLNNVDTVIHCAAVVSYHSSDAQLLHEVNVVGTNNIVNACIEAGVKNLIHISSIAAFGRNKMTSLVNESTIWMESSLNTNYAETKYLAELEAWRGANEGLNVAIVNPSVILAAGLPGRSSTQLLDYSWNEHRFLINGTMSYVDVRDVVEAVYSIYDKGIYGERFIINAGKVEYKYLFDQLAVRMMKKTPSIMAEGWLLWIALFLQTIKYWLTRSRPTVTREVIKTTLKDIEYDNRKSIIELKINYRSLENSLDWVCEEYKIARQN